MAKKALSTAQLAIVQAVEAVVAEICDPFTRWAKIPTVIVACSGGADSLALALAASVVRDRHGVNTVAAVVDHQLQDGSGDVAAKTAATLDDFGLTTIIKTVKVHNTGEGIEAAARDARYQALAETAAEIDADFVLLGHTLDDQAETVLLGLARGSGARSLAGMPARRGVFVRPLLGIRRETTEQACTDWGVTPWEDPHNADPQFARVRARTRVIPVLEDQLGPGIVEALARTADLLRADADHLDAVATEALDEAVDDEGRLALPQLRQHSEAVVTRVIHQWLKSRGLHKCASTHVFAVKNLIDSYRGQGPIHVPGGSVRREKQVLVCEPAN